MSFDLAIATNGDLILSASRDLQGATGIAIIEQRIRLRLQLNRGAWIYDSRGKLGSNLNELFGLEPEIAAQRVVPLVREALRPMEEIEVEDVIASPGVSEITVIIYYRLLFVDDSTGVSERSEIQSTGVGIPIGG